MYFCTFCIHMQHPLALSSIIPIQIARTMFYLNEHITMILLEILQVQSLPIKGLLCPGEHILPKTYVCTARVVFSVHGDTQALCPSQILLLNVFPRSWEEQGLLAFLQPVQVYVLSEQCRSTYTEISCLPISPQVSVYFA